VKHEIIKAIINGQPKTEEGKNGTVQELCEMRTQLQASINDLTKTVESLKQAVHLPCGQQKIVSTYDVEGVTTSKFTAVPPGINIVKILPNDVIS
jgi:hypothetical protein